MQDVIISELSSSLAVVCHDAGATNLILPWLKSQPSENRHVVMQGPAKKLWSTLYPEEKLIDNIYEALNGVEVLLTGTGWSSNLEHEARMQARNSGVYSIAVIDHWVNYQERFSRNHEIVMPDELWVTDEYALTEAKKCFPKEKIKLKHNLYLSQQLKLISPVEQLITPEFLYLIEPTRNDWGRNIKGEFQAMDFFVEKLSKLNLPENTVIRLRPHPSDPDRKYADWLKRHKDLNILLDDSPSLAKSISRARWVAGCETFALILSMEAGRQVYCTLPPWARDCRLPQKGILHLKNIE